MHCHMLLLDFINLCSIAIFWTFECCWNILKSRTTCALLRSWLNLQIERVNLTVADPHLSHNQQEKKKQRQNHNKQRAKET